MRYTIEVSRRAEKFLRVLTDKNLYRRLREALDELESDPHPMGSVKLQGSEDLFRIRVGDYRVIYQVRDAVLIVLVVSIGHRREVYR